ncbi:hypothetical protein ABKN59_008429 [Abortiporus biennis]
MLARISANSARRLPRVAPVARRFYAEEAFHKKEKAHEDQRRLSKRSRSWPISRGNTLRRSTEANPPKVSRIGLSQSKLTTPVLRRRKTLEKPCLWSSLLVKVTCQTFALVEAVKLPPKIEQEPPDTLTIREGGSSVYSNPAHTELV